ncbi:DUF551 domain-containing protein [Pseudomonas nitroreducens]|uniref:DUF551 domain-containing protein n=1 Tax=Pseudomonas nitroreducens TaxID=46680 RepID=UPI0026592CCD|nr:DUF551 domain-containing protein [Pseudomonas nitroreducens]MCP1651655.1 hypothetical protein [Pseudomonas nitroreducens]MCP1684480.1 hypothetical protein [Pseudomonas nitroreducens]
MSEWIKCSDRLPELDIPVWIDGPECAGIGIRATDGESFVWGFAMSGPYWDADEGWIVDVYDFDLIDPVRWMSLPEPPEEAP